MWSFTSTVWAGLSRLILLHFFESLILTDSTVLYGRKKVGVWLFLFLQLPPEKWSEHTLTQWKSLLTISILVGTRGMGRERRGKKWKKRVQKRRSWFVEESVFSYLERWWFICTSLRMRNYDLTRVRLVYCLRLMALSQAGRRCCLFGSSCSFTGLPNLPVCPGTYWQSLT